MYKILENFIKNINLFQFYLTSRQKAKSLRVDLCGFMRASAVLLAVNLQLRVKVIRQKLVEDNGMHLLCPYHLSVCFFQFSNHRLDFVLTVFKICMAYVLFTTVVDE